MQLAAELPDVFLLPQPKQGSKSHFNSLPLGLQSSNPEYITHKHIVDDYVGPHYVYSSHPTYTS
jgi:hypothetical protein